MPFWAVLCSPVARIAPMHVLSECNNNSAAPPPPPGTSHPSPSPTPLATTSPCARMCTALQAPYSAKADVWSLGCVVYHMMMLRPPFDGTNPLSVAHKIVEGCFDPLADPPPGAGLPPYSPQLKGLVGAMMTVDPNRWVGGWVGGCCMRRMRCALARCSCRYVCCLYISRYVLYTYTPPCCGQFDARMHAPMGTVRRV